MNNADVPHISAQCAHCGFIFDLKFGTSCPACHGIGVKWARLVTEQEAQERGAYAQQELRKSLEAFQAQVEKDVPFMYSPYSHAEGDLKDIAELNRIYAMEDTR